MVMPARLPLVNCLVTWSLMLYPVAIPLHNAPIMPARTSGPRGATPARMQRKTPAEVLGAEIREARLAKGLTIAELAKRLHKKEHVNGNARLSRLENGQANPRINDIAPIAKVLGRRFVIVIEPDM